MSHPDPHAINRKQFVTLLDNAIAYAANCELPLSDTYTILSFFAQRQMNILIAKAEEAELEEEGESASQAAKMGTKHGEYSHGVDIQKDSNQGSRIQHPSGYNIDFGTGIPGQPIGSSNPGVSGSGAYQANELAQQFNRGQCPDCPKGGPSICPLDCPAVETWKYEQYKHSRTARDDDPRNPKL